MNKKLIGIYGVRIYEQNVMPFIHVLKNKCTENGFTLISFCGSADGFDNPDEIIAQYQFEELICKVDICALIILSETIKNDITIQKLVNIGKSKNIPVFSLDRKVKGCYNLLMDNADCFEKIVRHVVEDHGCKHINMIAGDNGEYFSEERIAAYRKVLEENGIPFEQDRIGYGDYWELPIPGIIRHFFESSLPFPDAIVCANDIMAHTAITVLNEHGMEVPEDIIVTGYDGTKNGEIFFPSITTGAPDFETMVELFFKEVTIFLENNIISPCDIIVPVKMKLCQSCGCHKKELAKEDRRISRMLDELGNGKWHMHSMRMMLSDSFGKMNIEDIYPLIPKHMDSWFDFYRYICIKSELLDTYEISENFNDVTCILDSDHGTFKEIGNNWNISEFQTYIDRILENEKSNCIFVRLLISGRNVYGFTLENFKKTIDWEIKQCDEFSMFLSHILHSVIHNHKMNDLNSNLQKLYKEVQEMSVRDSMTGILNRRGFFLTLQHLLNSKENLGKYLYLYMVDMDGLKYINDNFGHSEGDFAIMSLANAMTQLGDDCAICARVGGDEFICAHISETPDYHSVEELTLRLDNFLANNEECARKPYSISASIGMMCTKISEQLDLDSLINSADDNMYRKKAARKQSRTQ